MSPLMTRSCDGLRPVVDNDEARRRLEAMVADLDDTVRTLDNEHAGEIDVLSSVDQHPADVATEVSDGEREAAILELARAQRASLLAALRRLDEGTYGRCVDCGRPLPAERLEARPEAARCVADQHRLESAS